ncbi:hypothetical protein [Psychromonas aquimarina]|uniref:hypothetical protein n=1 Tax=Psychromonas aquimarina TaxID=444919 RepID=UPI001B7F7FCF|nr:hypothetical protein [Psychromonas aquimarina]
MLSDGYNVGFLSKLMGQAYCKVIMDSKVSGKKLMVSTEDDAISLKAFEVILAAMPKQ